MPTEDIPVVKRWVSHRDVAAVYDNWFAMDGNATYYKFWKFIGDRESVINGYMMNEEALNRLGMLLGPHHKAITRAWKVKHAGYK